MDNDASLVLYAIDHFPVVVAKRFFGQGTTPGLVEAVGALNRAHRFSHRVLVEAALFADQRLVDAARAGGSVARIGVADAHLQAFGPETGLPQWLSAARERDTLVIWDNMSPRDAGAVIPALQAAGVPALIGTVWPVAVSVPCAVFPAPQPTTAPNALRLLKAAPPVPSSVPNRSALSVLADLVDANMLSEETAPFLVQCVRSGFNVLLVGPPASGKTTLLGALAREGIPPHDHVLVLQDVDELQLQRSLPCIVSLVSGDEATPLQLDGSTLLDVLRRVRPERMVVGDMTRGDALAFLEQGYTSQGLLATGSVSRLESIAPRFQWIARSQGYGLSAVEIAEAVGTGLDLLVEVCGPGPTHGRRVTRVVEPLREGDWTTLWDWDAAQGALVRVGALSAARQRLFDGEPLPT